MNNLAKLADSDVSVPGFVTDSIACFVQVNQNGQTELLR